ncbi:CocE/NonD family hydrolase [Hazenella sp. IB182357]|uniref:CocE/NonD family hydrolase n=1 Tax=Polycladospora coralii TaxID=2771432 RepID=A0A926NIJ2_9BACL|nr:CocE/NonD family hydrolase [Polycladospora coralii]MBD1373908.1 CocE/NonD family hydrolase [Polycladospora coralii]
MIIIRTDLKHLPFHYYYAGVYQGEVQFKEERIMHAIVEPRQRTQMNENILSEGLSSNLPFKQIHEHLDLFANAKWEGERVVLPNGFHYERYKPYQAVIKGKKQEGIVWALRNETALDVITVEGILVAFICPHRHGMEILVQPGYEDLTPLVAYRNPQLSQPEYGVNDMGTYMVPMKDGTRLATDVYLPEGKTGIEAFPTILVRTCYDRSNKKGFLMHWVNKGYAVVNQDVRGRADSEGELVPFYYERDDGKETIDWIIAQAWSNGDVGIWGASYLGYVAIAAATSGHPNLKAVVDEVNVGSPFTDTVRRGGAVCSWPLLSWTLAQSVGNRTDFSIFAGESVDVETVVDARPIREIPQQVIGKRSGPWDLWSQHPEYDDFWRNCTLTERGDQIQAPVFVISGWYDGDGPGVSETWRMLTEHDVPHRKIWLGPWEHNPNRARDFRGTRFSHDAVVYDYDIKVMSWFDRFLKGMENGIEQEPRATYYVVGNNEWRTSEDWTPVEATITPLYLGGEGHANSSFGDGLLHYQPIERAKTDTFVYNPKYPVAYSGEREPENMAQHELRQDILVYTSEKLEEDMIVAGELSAEIYAASTATDTDWVVTLTDVDEDGNSLRLSDYIVRAKYRKGLDQAALLTPNQVERYDIYMQNIAHTFRKGHRLRFTITSSNKFVVFPNSNTGENPYDEQEAMIAKQTVYHSPKYPSHIRVPVINKR